MVYHTCFRSAKTVHGAFTCNQQHTYPEMNTEGADLVSFPPVLGSRQGQPAEPAAAHQLCNSSWRFVMESPLHLMGMVTLSSQHLQAQLQQT